MQQNQEKSNKKQTVIITNTEEIATSKGNSSKVSILRIQVGSKV